MVDWTMQCEGKGQMKWAYVEKGQIEAGVS